MTRRYLMAHPATTRRFAWVRALGEAAAFLFVLAVLFVAIWLSSP